MSGIAKNTAKMALRAEIKDLVRKMKPEQRSIQSQKIAEKLFSMPIYKKSKRVSIYLSTEYEVNTIGILRNMFYEHKEVFVPTYKGDNMELVRVFGMEDYNSLPVTKWEIKQPSFEDDRENPIKTYPLDLILLPGVAFTGTGGRCGHGRGYYDKYLARYFQRYPEKCLNGPNKTILIGLAFQEQLVDSHKLPIEPTDFPIDLVLTSD